MASKDDFDIVIEEDRPGKIIDISGIDRYIEPSLSQKKYIRISETQPRSKSTLNWLRKHNPYACDKYFIYGKVKKSLLATTSTDTKLESSPVQSTTVKSAPVQSAKVSSTSAPVIGAELPCTSAPVTRAPLPGPPGAGAGPRLD